MVTWSTQLKGKAAWRMQHIGASPSAGPDIGAAHKTQGITGIYDIMAQRKAVPFH
jgi:hypothetical protein